MQPTWASKDNSFILDYIAYQGGSASVYVSPIVSKESDHACIFATLHPAGWWGKGSTHSQTAMRNAENKLTVD